MSLPSNDVPTADSVTTRILRSNLWIWFFLFLIVVVPAGYLSWRRFVGGQVVNASAGLISRVQVDPVLPKWIETKIGVKKARPFGYITRIHVSGHTIGDIDTVLRWLWWQPRLTQLWMYGGHCTNDSFGLLANNCSNLESLSIYQGQLRTQDIQSISTLQNLRELNLSEVTAPELGFDPLGRLPKLRHLGLTTNPQAVTDQAWESLARLGNVESLLLRANDSDIEALIQAPSQHEPVLPRLWFLTLVPRGASIPLTGRTLNRLSLLPNLTHLTLSGTRVDDLGLEQLESVSRLRQLYLAHCPITDEGCKSLAKLTNLESLHLGGTKITIAGVQHLVGLKRLRQLTIKECYKIRGQSEIDSLPKSFLSRCRVVR